LSSNESFIAESGLLKPKVEKETELEPDTYFSREHSHKDRKKRSLESSIVNGESSLKNSKKRKRDKSESDATISETLVSESKGKKRRVDKSESTVKHTSEKSAPNLGFLNIIQNIKQEVESDFETPKKKKKSKHSK